jgi:phospholipid/cholesterol/gamma-HCH transport system substrate-binding protein/paraquat-inducible protein B
MRQRAHYVKIGLFVIGATILAAVGIIVLEGGKWFERMTMVETYFNESVQGLEIGAPVRLRGVRMGRVESIRLAREEYNIAFNPEVGLLSHKGVVVVRMSVHLSVAAHFPETDEEMRMRKAVDAGWRFRLASQGITGVLYIESEFVDPERYPPMEIAWTPKTPYIPSAPSTITELGADLRSITRKLEQVDIEKITKDLDTLLTSVTQVVKDVQAEHLESDASQLLVEMRETLQDARRVLDNPHLTKTLKDSGVAMEDFRRTAADLSYTAKDMRAAMTQLPGLVAHLNQTVHRIDTLLAEKGETVDDVLENLQLVSEDVRNLTKTIEAYPSQVLFGEPPPRKQIGRR